MRSLALLIPLLLPIPGLDPGGGQPEASPAVLLWSPPRPAADSLAPSLRFSVDGLLVALCEADGIALVWQGGSCVPTWGRIGEDGRLALPGQTSLALRPDAAAPKESDVSGRPSIMRARPPSGLRAVSSSTVLVSHDGDGRLLWDLETGAVSVQQEDPVSTLEPGPMETELRIEDRGLAVTLASDGGVRLRSLDKDEVLLTLLLFEDDQWLVFEAGLGFLASGDAPANMRLVTGGKAYPLDCYSGLLWSSFSVGARLHGRPLPSPPILPPPEVEIVQETASKEGAATRLVITARDPVGIVSILVVQGERETIYPGEGNPEVRVVCERPGGGALGELRVTAVNAMNVSSPALRWVEGDPAR